MAAGHRSLTESDQSIGDQLAGWGKVAVIETIGRISGVPASTAVGFVEDADGSLLVAAGDEAADWALNLAAHPICRATVGERVATYRADVVPDSDRGVAITRLILKYGTPAEGLGHGPVFRLTPLEAA